MSTVLAFGAGEEQSWQILYDSGFPVPGVTAWASPLTSSQRTSEGPRIADPSNEAGSGRFYQCDWHVDPQAGATIEARLRVASCSAPCGVTLLVSDGTHEEGVTFYPDRVVLTHANLSTKIPAAIEGTGDDGNPYEGPLADHAIIGLRDGSLLATVFGQFKNDRVLVPTMPPEWQCFKYQPRRGAHLDRSFLLLRWADDELQLRRGNRPRHLADRL